MHGYSTGGSGVAGTGRIGMYALGATASAPAGTQIFGTFSIVNEVTSGPAVVAQVGVNPSTTYPTGVALYGFVPQKNLHGLWANGGVKLPDRSGKTRIPSGKSSVEISVPGITSSNFAVATLVNSRSDRWVRSAVCTSGKLTITLNTSVSKATYVGWLVLG